MAAPGGAFSAALRRSQDLDIGEQTHRHADRSARGLRAHRLFSSLHPTSNKLVHLGNYFLARWRAKVFVVYLIFFFFFFFIKIFFLLFFRFEKRASVLPGYFFVCSVYMSLALFFRCENSAPALQGLFYVELNRPVALQQEMFWCVNEGRMPNWANATGRNCKMSTLLYHPLEIDCITFKKVAPRINRDALFQERRWWTQSTGCSLSLSLSLSCRDHRQRLEEFAEDNCVRSPGHKHL